MTVRSAEIALGLAALACALKAKAGILRDADRLSLLRDVMTFAWDDLAWRDAALAFEADSRADPAAAGRALHDWIAGGAGHVVLSTAQADEVLARIAAEAGGGDG